LNKYICALVILVTCGLLQGCFVTKLVTVPLRVGGAVLSAVPGVGNAADEAIDTTADVIDGIPL
jgi:hypothetical protein